MRALPRARAPEAPAPECVRSLPRDRSAEYIMCVDSSALHAPQRDSTLPRDGNAEYIMLYRLVCSPRTPERPQAPPREVPNILCLILESALHAPQRGRRTKAKALARHARSRYLLKSHASSHPAAELFLSPDFIGTLTRKLFQNVSQRGPRHWRDTREPCTFPKSMLQVSTKRNFLADLISYGR